MEVKAAIALALAAVTAPTFAADDNLISKLKWSFDVGTHVYSMDTMDSFKPSLELGMHATLPLSTLQAGTLAVEGGFSQTAIHGSSDLKTPMAVQGYSLETSQVSFRRAFVALSFETQGRWFVKPQIGFEHITSKLRLYDPNNNVGFIDRDGDSNIYAEIGIGHRYTGGKKALLSFATLSDMDDNDHYRITYSASL